MKKTFYKAFNVITMMALLLVAAFPAYAQFTNTTLETGGLYTALAKDGNNNVYVTRAQAGTSGQFYEVVEYINGTGSPVTVYQNLSHEAGDYPWGLAVASNGDVYVSTDFSNYNGAVIKLTNNNGSYSAATFMTGKYYAALAVDANDNLYTTEYNSGTLKYNVVKYPAGSITGAIIYGNLTAGAGYSYPTGLAVASNGNVFVTDDYSNDPLINDGGKITKLTAPAYTATTVNSGNYASSLAVDAAGNLYSSENDGTGYKLVKYTNGAGAPATVYTPLHTNTFIYPWGIAVIDAYNIFVADGADAAYGGTITKLTSILPNPTTIAASRITTTSATLNGVVNADGYNAKVSFTYGTSATLTGATTTAATIGGTAVSNGGNTNAALNITGLTPATKYYYRVTANNINGTTIGAILSFTTNGPVPAISYTTPNVFLLGAAASLTPTSTGGAIPALTYAQVIILAGNSTAGSTNGLGAAASFNNPFGVATDAAGTIYLADHSGNLIRKITALGQVTTLAGSGVAGSTNATGSAASFHNPAGVAADAAGNLYIGDFGNNMIRKVSTSGVVTTIAGYGPAGSNNGAGSSATFNGPAGVALDASGNLFVADATNNLIRKIAPDATVSTFAGSGAAGSANGTGTAASFNNPQGIAVDFTGNVYVADYSGNLIRKITPGGVVTTLAGSGSAGSADGTGAAASFKNPAGLVVDASGNLYVADAGNNMIRKVTPGGVVTTVAGATTAGATNGIGTAARFSSPHGLALNSAGLLYVGDFNNNRLRRLPVNGYGISAALPAGLTFAGTTGVISGTPTHFSLPTNYTVTAYNNTGSGSAVVNIKVPADATLSNLALSAGTLNPAFASATISYTTIVPFAASTIKLTPTTTDAAATIKVNGATVASGTASGAIPLAVGSNAVTTVVTGADGVTTKTYTVTVTRAAAGLSTNAALSVIALNPKSTLTSNGTANGVTSYTTSVPNSESSVTVTPTAQDANATIKVNGTTVASGTASASIPLSVGDNTITLVCTAQDGATVRTYVITATRAPSTIATLSNLVPNSGTLNPAFASATTNYSMIVPNATATMRFIPTATDATATIVINDATVPSGVLSSVIQLNVGSNDVTAAVTAQDGTTTKNYNVSITRAAAGLSTNAALSVIALTPQTSLTSTGTVNGVTGYTTSVPFTETSLTVTPTAQNAYATITVNGVAVASGTASQSIPLAVGDNTITLVCTAQDGATVRTYAITATRAVGNATATLSNLVLNAGTLNPVFASGTTGYTAAVPYATASIRVTPTVTDPTATIKVNGTTVASGTLSGVIALNVGSNSIMTVVTAQNGTTTMTYTVAVTRAAAGLSTNAALSVIALTPQTSLTSNGTSNGVTSYSTSVPNSESSLTVTPTAQDANATITVNGIAVASGTASQSIPLAVGDNTITLVCTAQDGATTRTYAITATRAASGLFIKYDEPAAMPLQVAGVTVHQGLSPNGDGDNDILTIDGITNYPDNNLQIMTRSGELVYQVKGYDNRNKVFDGQSNINGKLQPAGTYLYSLEYKDGSEIKHKTGFIVLKY